PFQENPIWIPCPGTVGHLKRARYEETVTFYRDTIGLPVLETFHDSYGLDGTISSGCRAARFTWRSSVPGRHRTRAAGWTSWCSTCLMLPPGSRWGARLAAAGAGPVPQIGCWQANGGVTYQDPDGREAVFASWIYIPPGSRSARRHERCNASRNLRSCSSQLAFDWLISTRWPSGSRRKQRISVPQSCGGVRNAAPLDRSAS